MNSFERLIHALSAEWEVPTVYGWFHLTFCGILAAVTLALCLLFANAKEKTFRRVLFCGWILIFLFEFYKQLTLSLEVENGIAVWSFSWYHFPFQLCSSPLYLLPLAAFLPESRARDGILFFLATYSLVGGASVYIYPDTVFVEAIGRCIQTMVHHGLQVAFGILIFVHEQRKILWRNFLAAIPCFLFLVGIALALNIGVHSAIPDQTFNMFFISPYFSCEIPIFGEVYPGLLPYPLFLVLYILVLTLASAILFSAAYGVRQIACRKCKNSD